MGWPLRGSVATDLDVEPFALHLGNGKEQGEGGGGVGGAGELAIFFREDLGIPKSHLGPTPRPSSSLPSTPLGLGAEMGVFP